MLGQFNVSQTNIKWKIRCNLFLDSQGTERNVFVAAKSILQPLLKDQVHGFLPLSPTNPIRQRSVRNLNEALVMRNQDCFSLSLILAQKYDCPKSNNGKFIMSEITILSLRRAQSSSAKSL